MCTTMKELTTIVDDYRSMKALQKETEAILKSLEEEILGYLAETGKAEETGPDYTIKLTECTRESLDKKALEQVFGEGLKAYMKTTSYRRLTVK